MNIHIKQPKKIDVIGVLRRKSTLTSDFIQEGKWWSCSTTLQCCHNRIHLLSPCDRATLRPHELAPQHSGSTRPPPADWLLGSGAQPYMKGIRSSQLRKRYVVPSLSPQAILIHDVLERSCQGVHRKITTTCDWIQQYRKKKYFHQFTFLRKAVALCDVSCQRLLLKYDFLKCIALSFCMKS